MEKRIEELVDILKQRQNNTGRLYPLSETSPELVKSITGKKMAELDIKDLSKGNIDPDDIRISGDVLKIQAQIASDDGKKQLAENLLRAAELTKLPDELVLMIYNMLRPKRSTYDELINIADKISEGYGAVKNAKLIKEAAEVYKSRDILKSKPG